MSEIRILALHGFPGTFGCAKDVDAMTRLKEGLKAHDVIVHIHAPRAQNPTQDGSGVAWLAGDQRPLGKIVGFSITDGIVQVEGPESTTPKPLTEKELPALSPEDDVWRGVVGFEASLAFLEKEWTTSDFDGILGFSQGAMMAAMFCAHLRWNRPDLAQPKFAILVGGFMRPWPTAARSWWPPRVQLTTPSLHVIGKQDTVVANCRSLELFKQFVDAAKYFHNLIGHPVCHGGHVVPWPGCDGDDTFFSILAQFITMASFCYAPSLAPTAKRIRRSLSTTPLPMFGVEIQGIDIAAGIDAEALQELWNLNIHREGLVVIRGQGELKHKPAAFLNFARGLVQQAGGDPPSLASEPPTAFNEGKQLFGASDIWVPGYPDIRRIGNLHKHGGPPHVLSRVGRQWHMDGHKGEEPLLSFILGVEPGPKGSETLFASGYAAYDALSEAKKACAESVICVMSNKYRSGGPVAADFEKGLRMSDNGLRLLRGVEPSNRLTSWSLDERCERPVCIHPETHRKALQIAPVALDHVVGMEHDVEAGRSLVEELLAPGTADERVYVHEWEEGDLVFWDNRAVFHSTTPYTYGDHRRSLWQVVLRYHQSQQKKENSRASCKTYDSTPSQ